MTSRLIYVIIKSHLNALAFGDRISGVLNGVLDLALRRSKREGLLMRVLSQSEIDAILAELLMNPAVLPVSPAEGATAENEKADAENPPQEKQ